MYDNIWLKRVWIPLWVIQLILLILLLFASAFGLAGLREYKDDVQNELSNDDGINLSEGEVNTVWHAAYAVLGVWIAVTCLGILQNVAEIVLLARKKLSPVVAVVLESISTFVWLVLFIMACVGLGNNGAAFGFIWLIIIFATSLGKLIYSSVILHRFRQGRSRGTYTPALATGLDPGNTTAYNPPPNPFRDPSREPSPAPRPYGEAAGYYNDGPNIEMQQQQRYG